MDANTTLVLVVLILSTVGAIAIGALYPRRSIQTITREYHVPNRPTPEPLMTRPEASNGEYSVAINALNEAKIWLVNAGEHERAAVLRRMVSELKDQDPDDEPEGPSTE